MGMGDPARWTSVGSKVGAAIAREGQEESRMPWLTVLHTMGEIWELGSRPQLSLHISGVATLPLGIPAFWNYQDPALSEWTSGSHFVLRQMSLEAAHHLLPPQLPQCTGDSDQSASTLRTHSVTEGLAHLTGMTAVPCLSLPSIPVSPIREQCPVQVRSWL